MYVNGGQSGWACEHDIVGETEECFNEIFGNNVFVICLSLKFDLTWSLAGDQWSAVQQLPSRPSQICHRYCDELTTCRKWAYAFSLGKVPSSGLIFCKTDVWFALAFKQVVCVIIFGRHKSHTKPVQTSIPTSDQDNILKLVYSYSSQWHYQCPNCGTLVASVPVLQWASWKLVFITCNRLPGWPARPGWTVDQCYTADCFPSQDQD